MKIKEFKNDDMALQIQSLDLFENLVRVSFAETNDENNDREAQESTINQIIGNKQMSDYNKYVVDYSDEGWFRKPVCKKQDNRQVYIPELKSCTGYWTGLFQARSHKTGPLTGFKTGQVLASTSCPVQKPV